MAIGLTTVKEFFTQTPERFVAAGFVTLLFDYRFFGGSEGEPRSQVFPLEMAEDCRNAITWVSQQPEVDPGRIGIWGTSYGGALVIWVGTFDKRVKAVVAQVPGIMNPTLRRAINPERWGRLGELLLRDRIERYKTGAVNYMKFVAAEGEPSYLPGKEAYDGYMAYKEKAPNWRNQITLESLEKMREFDAISSIELMSPTALLLVVAEKERLATPIDVNRATFEKARPPKDMIVLPVGHFEMYREPWLSKSLDPAINWFKQYL
jgi:acetyl esterase/lipase